MIGLLNADKIMTVVIAFQCYEILARWKVNAKVILFLVYVVIGT